MDIKTLTGYCQADVKHILSRTQITNAIIRTTLELKPNISRYQRLRFMNLK